MMLGYVLRLPSAAMVKSIDARIRATYGEAAKLDDLDAHADALSVHSGDLVQGTEGHVIRLMHIFVDATSAAGLTDAALLA
jgi:hypothetical protein